jgi:hypothetical protein
MRGKKLNASGQLGNAGILYERDIQLSHADL